MPPSVVIVPDAGARPTVGALCVQVGGATGVPLPVAPVEVLPITSTAQIRYEYCVPFVRPVCVVEVVADPNGLPGTAVPAVQLAGAVAPVANLTMYVPVVANPLPASENPDQLRLF